MSATVKNGGNGTSSWVWPAVIAAGIGLLQAFWVTVWGNISSETTRLQHQIDALVNKIDLAQNALSGQYVPRLETNEYHDKIKDELDSFHRQIVEIRRQIERTHDNYIAKEVYVSRSDAVTAEITRINGRLDEIRRDFGSTYTLNDKLKEIGDQLRVLQDKVFSSHRTAATANPPQGP